MNQELLDLLRDILSQVIAGIPSSPLKPYV
jgi:hypothetical protein